jgi:hypothetical protein
VADVTFNNLFSVVIAVGSVVGVLAWIVGFLYMTWKTNAEAPFSACCVTYVVGMVVAVVAAFVFLLAGGVLVRLWEVLMAFWGV